MLVLAGVCVMSLLGWVLGWVAVAELGRQSVTLLIGMGEVLGAAGVPLVTALRIRRGSSGLERGGLLRAAVWFGMLGVATAY